MENLELRAFAEYWWVLLIRGIAAIIFGLVALFWPGLTAYALLLTFGIFALVDGVMAIIVGFRRKGSDDRWWSWLIDGVLSILIGLMAIFWPVATAIALIIWIAAWAIVVGVMRIIAAIRLRHEIEGEWAMGLSGLLMVLWGVLLFAMPASGILSLTWLFGIFTLMVGIVMIIFAFRVKKLKAA
ncbi:HdeD family acid-resistance protein [Paracoccus sp. (in: a-proteobacteria)]|uniref:HdeD family acid-resistance protein n=1 Tax=Paracoccus sp. TaxID=267 RepID=UPI00289819A0|nr:HdeD family acid-resistance protein [Paracoccus sp. (in: a-proteobacteria)]